MSTEPSRVAGALGQSHAAATPVAPTQESVRSTRGSTFNRGRHAHLSCPSGDVPDYPATIQADGLGKGSRTAPTGRRRRHRPARAPATSGPATPAAFPGRLRGIPAVPGGRSPFQPASATQPEPLATAPGAENCVGGSVQSWTVRGSLWPGTSSVCRAAGQDYGKPG